MSDLPTWLASALVAHTTVESSFDSQDLTDVRPGDLWVVRNAADSVRRVVVVLNAEGCSLDVALTSNEVDWAADYDIVLQPEDTKSPYPLMVETLLTGKVPWIHATRRVGAIDDDLLDDVLDFIWDDRPPALEPRRGHPVLGPARGERLEFERGEARVMAALTTAAAEPAVAVDPYSSLDAVSGEECLEQLTAIMSDAAIVWSGCDYSAPASGADSASHEVDDLFGADIRKLYGQMIIGQRLLSGGVLVPFSDRAADTDFACVVSRQIDADWIIVHDASRAEDGPVGFLDSRPLFIVAPEVR